MNMKGTLLAAALIAIIGYLAIQLADARMSWPTHEMTSEMYR